MSIWTNEAHLGLVVVWWSWLSGRSRALETCPVWVQLPTTAGLIASFQVLEKSEGVPSTLFTHAWSLLGNQHTIHYTNHALTKQSISVYLVTNHTAELCSLWDTFGVLKSKILGMRLLVSQHLILYSKHAYCLPLQPGCTITDINYCKQ